ncbi:MAG: hypothetical protein WCP01_01780 [Methylococcaceae bacterium]
MLVRGVKLAVYLHLNRSRVTQMRHEGKIAYAYGTPLRLYDLDAAARDYWNNSMRNHVLSHRADKLDGWIRYVR